MYMPYEAEKDLRPIYVYSEKTNSIWFLKTSFLGISFIEFNFGNSVSNGLEYCNVEFPVLLYIMLKQQISFHPARGTPIGLLNGVP